LQHHLRPSPIDAPATRSWGSEPGASPPISRPSLGRPSIERPSLGRPSIGRPSIARPRALLAGALCLAFLLTACSAGSAPPSAAPTAGDSPSPSSPPPGAVQPPIDDVDEAIAAVAALEPQFLGYQPLDPDVIGASAWVEVADGEDVVILTFVRGWGDCPAGCINRAYAKFEVHKPDGKVVKICEWQQGEEAVGTPC
jgi:hypothetical protein